MQMNSAGHRYKYNGAMAFRLQLFFMSLGGRGVLAKPNFLIYGFSNRYANLTASRAKMVNIRVVLEFYFVIYISPFGLKSLAKPDVASRNDA